jgi:Icc-related predicted phosphoesterase
LISTCTVSHTLHFPSGRKLTIPTETNSSYFSDIDIARTHLVCTLFSTGIEQMRGGTAAITGSKRPVFGLPVGGVSCTFKKELKPYEPYELWTRVLSWDEKWIYIVTHFVRKGAIAPRKYTLYPQQNAGERKTGEKTAAVEGNEDVVATALSKCVFKQGRRTIVPELMLQLSGLLPPEPPDRTEAVDHCESVAKPVSEPSVRYRSRPSLPSSPSSDSGIDMEMDEKEEKEKEDSEWERIERERKRGLKVAATLGAQSQNALEREFTADGEALGRHADGTGFVGVVSTLAQLARLKRDQIL